MNDGGLKGVRVVVTGAAGFIGSHLVEALVARGASVRAMWLMLQQEASRGLRDCDGREPVVPRTDRDRFMPFYPDPGLGVHCISVDPFFLSWKARQNGGESRFIELAGHVNSAMPEYVVQQVADALNSAQKPIKGVADSCLRCGVQARRERHA